MTEIILSQAATEITLSQAVDEITLLQAIGDLLGALGNWALSLLSTFFVFVFNIAFNIINVVADMILRSFGFLAHVAKLLPTHLYLYLSVVVTCIIMRSLIKMKFGGGK